MPKLSVGDPVQLGAEETSASRSSDESQAYVVSKSSSNSIDASLLSQSALGPLKLLSPLLPKKRPRAEGLAEVEAGASFGGTTKGKIDKNASLTIGASQGSSDRSAHLLNPVAAGSEQSGYLSPKSMHISAKGPRGGDSGILRYKIETSKRLGAIAWPPSDTGSLWKLDGIREGEQADQLGIKNGLFILSLDGKKVTLDDDLSDILCELKKSLTSYDLVLTDTDPVREAVKSSDPDGTKVASSDRIQSDRGLLLPTAENDVPINSQNDSEDENEEFNTCSSPPVTAIEIHPSSIQEGFEAKALNHVRKYDHSSKKDIGSRVYAEYSNGQYYWGKISNRKNGREFGVLFEDTAFLDGIAEDLIFTEEEYIEMFNHAPPEPIPIHEGDDISAGVSYGRMEKAGGIEKIRKNSTEKNKKSLLEFSNFSTKITSNDEIRMPALTLPISSEYLTQYAGQRMGNWSPRKLLKKRCGVCMVCTRPDCGLCTTCRRKTNVQNVCEEPKEGEVCLRNICPRIKIKRRQQPAVGFSQGWMYYFERKRMRTSQATGRKLPECYGIRIVAPDGNMFSSIEIAAKSDTASLLERDHIVQLFRSHVGLAENSSHPSHLLVGRGYCHEWTNKEGEARVLFGLVSRCSKSGDTVMFDIDYSHSCISFLNDSSPPQHNIEPLQQIPLDIAFGGCMLFERKNNIPRARLGVVNEFEREIPCRSFVVPEMRKEEFTSGDASTLPRLSLLIRGYKLVFKVAPSTEHNTGNGLFVKCTSLCNDIININDAGVFSLNPGELLDLGVHAPNRSGDKKHISVFNLKNYVFSMACEEWAFYSSEKDYVYDSTDDGTGKVRKEAEQNILSYINRNGGKGVRNVHTEFDPEGCMHYYMGTRYNGDWDIYKKESRQFELEVGGDNVELFLDCAEEHGDMQICNENSILAMGKQKERCSSFSKQEDVFIQDIKFYDAMEVAMSIDFFLSRCFTEDHLAVDRCLADETIDRGLRVARMLLDRAGCLFTKANTKSDTPVSSIVESLEGLSRTLDAANSLVSRLAARNGDKDPGHKSEKINPFVRNPDFASDGEQDVDEKYDVY